MSPPRRRRRPRSVCALERDLMSLLTDQDVYLFNEGTHVRMYDKLGAHPMRREGQDGTHFAVWAPNAASVAVIGDFNAWQAGTHPLAPRGSSGIWEAFIPGIGVGAIYKFHIASQLPGFQVDKADPYAFQTELPPRTGSVVAAPVYDWQDAEWMAGRGRSDGLDAPMTIYEVHLGSWQRSPADPDRLLSYRDIAPRLAA